MCPLLNGFRDTAVSLYSTLYTVQTSSTPCPHTSCKAHWFWRWNFRKCIILGKLYKLCHLNNEYRYYKQYVISLSLSRKLFGIGHMYIYTMTSKNIVLSYWDTLYICVFLLSVSYIFILFIPLSFFIPHMSLRSFPLFCFSFIFDKFLLPLSFYIHFPPSYILSVFVCSLPYFLHILIPFFIDKFPSSFHSSCFSFLSPLVSVKSQGNILIWKRRISQRIFASLYVLWERKKQSRLLQWSLLCPGEYLLILCQFTEHIFKVNYWLDICIKRPILSLTDKLG
jgi:hypothetical protein